MLIRSLGIALGLVILSTAATQAGELDAKHSINEATVLMHPYPVPSYTQPLLSSQSAEGISTSSRTSENDVKQERDIFTEHLFPGIQPLHIIARNISELQEKEKKLPFIHYEEFSRAAKRLFANAHKRACRNASLPNRRYKQ